MPSVISLRVAPFNESMVTLGEHRPAVARCAAKQFPDYARWQNEVAALTRLSNPDSPAQQVLNAVRALPEAEWNKHLCGFSDLIAFSLWMELVLDIEGPTSGLVSKELAERYGGFSLPGALSDPRKLFAHLTSGYSSMDSQIAEQENLLAALSFHVSHHPAYPAMRRYALHCHDAWLNEYSGHLPSFEEWREAADAYFEE